MNPVTKDMELLSNSMATYAHIKDNLESFALYFMLGVCFGLLLALTLLILSATCRPHPATAMPSSPGRRQLKQSSVVDENEAEDESADQADGEEAEVPKVTMAPMSDHSPSNGTIRSINVFTSAEELERARRSCSSTASGETPLIRLPTSISEEHVSVNKPRVLLKQKHRQKSKHCQNSINVTKQFHSNYK